MHSVYTGAPSSSATSTISFSASPWAMASPAIRMGRLALARRSAAASTAALSPRVRGPMRVGASRSSSRSAFRTSTGSEMNTGPVGWASAVLAARRTARGRSSRRVISCAHLTQGRATGVSSDQRMGSVRFIA